MGNLYRPDEFRMYVGIFLLMIGIIGLFNAGPNIWVCLMLAVAYIILKYQNVGGIIVSGTPLLLGAGCIIKTVIEWLS